MDGDSSARCVTCYISALMENKSEGTTFRNCWSRGWEGERIQSSASGPPGTHSEDEK